MSFADSLCDVDGAELDGELSTERCGRLEQDELNDYPDVIKLIITPGPVHSAVASMALLIAASVACLVRRVLTCT